MKLSKTEYRVAEYIAKGFTEKEIAEKMFISPHTAHNHAYRIRKKWKARTAVDVTRKFILSLDNPKQFFTTVLFLLIQGHIIFNCVPLDLRKPVRTSTRIVRTSRKYEA